MIKKIITTAVISTALLMGASKMANAEKVKPQDTFKFNTSTECMFQWKSYTQGNPLWWSVDFDETGTPTMGDKYQYPVMKTFYYRSDTKASFITQTCQIDSTISQYSYPEFIDNMKKN